MRPEVISAPRILLISLATLAGSAALTASAPPTSDAASSEPIVKVILYGGLCAIGRACRFVVRITNTAISGRGYVPRRLSRTARAKLLRDIATLDIVTIRKHLFNGTCWQRLGVRAEKRIHSRSPGGAAPSGRWILGAGGRPRLTGFTSSTPP